MIQPFYTLRLYSKAGMLTDLSFNVKPLRMTSFYHTSFSAN